MAWGKNGTSVTLGSSADNMDITDLTANKYNTFLIHKLATSAGRINETFNNNTNSVYAFRAEHDGGTDATSVNQSLQRMDFNENDDTFTIQQVCSILGKEKLGIFCTVSDGGGGAGSAPTRHQAVTKFVPSPDANITRIDLNNSSGGDLLSGSNLTVLGSDLTPAAAIPALDNVQDNSLFIEKENAKRYWFSKAPVVTDDLTTDKGWVSNTSDWTYNASGDYIDFATIRRSTTAQQIYIDVQDSDYLGSGNNLSDSAWTANFKVKTGTSASGNAMIYLGFSNNLADSGTTQQSATMKMNMSSSEGSLSLSVSRANFETSSSPARENADIYSSGNIPYSTDFYMTMTRSGDVFTLKAYSNSARTTQVGVTATVTVTGISSLRYIKAFNDSEQNQSYTSTGARLYDMEIINGTDTWTWDIQGIRGVFGGGETSTYVNTMDYITMATLGNATDFGNLTASRYNLSSVSSNTRGVFSGGRASSGSNTNIMDYITIATLGDATDFGDLTLARRIFAGVSSNTRGVFAGGYTSSDVNTMDYITIATLGNAIDFGDLTSARRGAANVSSDVRGIFGGGYTGSNVNTIDYITIATPSNAIDFGNLTVSRNSASGVSSDVRGVFAGGQTSTFDATMDYVTIATLGNATDFGDMTVARMYYGAVSSNIRGIFGGGHTGSITNVIDYITIATTGNATDFGDLSESRKALAGVDDRLK